MSKNNTLNQDIDALFAESKPLTKAELQSFGEKNREIINHPSFKAEVIKDQSKHAILEELGVKDNNQNEPQKPTNKNNETQN